MRDLARHPLTILEIEAACSRAALLIEQSDSVGDIDPVAIRAAATIALRAAIPKRKKKPGHREVAGFSSAARSVSPY